jgi:hypothetical protein
VPDVDPKTVPQTVGLFFKLVGNAIAGNHGEPAPDADCNGLAVKALK